MGPAKSPVPILPRPASKQAKRKLTSANSGLDFAATSATNAFRPNVAATKYTLANIETSLVRPFDDQEAQVLQASTLVVEEIRSGAWPCGFSEQRKKQQQQSTDASVDDQAFLSNVALQAYRNQWAAMVEMFAREIVLPSIMSYSTATVTAIPPTTATHVVSATKSENRTFLGTMLALREVMTQNDEMFFGSQTIVDSMEREEKEAAQENESKAPEDKQETEIVDLVDDGSDEVAAATVANNKAKTDNNDKKAETQRCAQEERLYSARLLATGIILSAVLRLPRQGQVLHDQLLRIFDSYDTGSDEFASCLERTDGNWRGVLPNGSCLNRDETFAWKASFNRARDEHPLIIQSKRRKLEQSCAEAKIPYNREQELVMVAKPNLCFAGVVEDLTTVMLERGGLTNKAG